MQLIEKIDPENIPKHIAIIMDGNGRWAKQNGKMRIAGHNKGAETLKNIIEAAGNIGVKYLTVYAFSLENWKRPAHEVNGLMSLLMSSIDKEIDVIMKNSIKILVIGDTAKLPSKVKRKVDSVVELTGNNQNLTLTIALSYGGRWEIAKTAAAIAKDVKDNVLNIDDINEELFAKYLNVLNIPDPELLIRTSGENRISNFLLYQLAYTELYFTDVLWPDFNKEELIKAILEYQKRERRFGKISEQLKR